MVRESSTVFNITFVIVWKSCKKKILRNKFNELFFFIISPRWFEETARVRCIHVSFVSWGSVKIRTKQILWYITKLMHHYKVKTVIFSNLLIIHEVNSQPQDVYHITCMCLDTQWKTVYHSPVREVCTTKICTMTTCTKSMNIYFSDQNNSSCSSLFTASL